MTTCRHTVYEQIRVLSNHAVPFLERHERQNSHPNYLIDMKRAMMLGFVLSLAAFGAGCASHTAWHPVTAETGMVYDSTRESSSERWPNAGFEYYRQKYWAPEIETDINQHQRITIQGVETPFVSSAAWPVFSSSDGDM